VPEEGWTVEKEKLLNELLTEKLASQGIENNFGLVATRVKRPAGRKRLLVAVPTSEGGDSRWTHKRFKQFVDGVRDLVYDTEAAKIESLLYSLQVKNDGLLHQALEKSKFKLHEFSPDHVGSLMASLDMSRRSVAKLNRLYKNVFGRS